MAYFNFINEETPLNDTNLNAMQKGLMELVFPIGSTYITQANTNPNTILGFGTWERLKGKVCLGLDESDTNLKTIGNTGGEKTHTLTEDEMPSHHHNLYAYATQDGTLTARKVRGTEDATAGKYVDGGTEYRGGGQAHNNMQPYEVVGYMWIRRS